MKNFLHAAHFQLMQRCNLACTFCGQRKGVLPENARGLPFEKWVEIAEKIQENAQKHGETAAVTLWGGEPLLYERFDELAAVLRQLGVKLKIVTNGTLIDRHVTPLCRDFEEINVSFDGFGASDDVIRGAGTFAKASKNIAMLTDRKGKLIVLLTVADHNIETLPEILSEFSRFDVDEIVLQPLMYLNDVEIADYRCYSRRNFGYDYPALSGYCRNDGAEFESKFKVVWTELEQRAYPFALRHTSHGDGSQSCRMSWTRVHIQYDGEVGFCTDYFGFSVGNVKNDSIMNLFNNELSQRFRLAVSRNELAICRHCSWRFQPEL